MFYFTLILSLYIRKRHCAYRRAALRIMYPYSNFTKSVCSFLRVLTAKERVACTENIRTNVFTIITFIILLGLSACVEGSD